MSATHRPPRCGDCRSFCNDPLYLERESPGLAALSSGFGSVRSSDGICNEHARYVPVEAVCARFAPAVPG
jgi:hypothetical protein